MTTSSPVRTLLLLAVPTLLVSLLFARPQFMMATVISPPEEGQPWADLPLEMIETPKKLTGKTDMWTIGATHMALVHNMVFRSFNSIWVQAPYVRDEDKLDFVNYALAWYHFVKHHHDDEEAELFPKVEELLKDKVFKVDHEEHEAFLPSLSAYGSYLTPLAASASAAKAFSAPELLSLMSAMRPTFESHFRNEIAHIASFASHPNSPPLGSPEEAAAHKTFEAWGKGTVMRAKSGALTELLPLFLYNHDGSWEAPLWENWPPIPGLVRRGLLFVGGSWHGSWWRFASCDGMGGRKALWSLQHPREAVDVPKEEGN